MEPWQWEVIRRSTVMLSQGQRAAIDRETALELLEELGRLQERDKQAQELARRLRELLEDFDARSRLPDG